MTPLAFTRSRPTQLQVWGPTSSLPWRHVPYPPLVILLRSLVGVAGIQEHCVAHFVGDGSPVVCRGSKDGTPLLIAVLQEHASPGHASCWVEVSRGFIVADSWDPTPLTESETPARHYKKGGHRPPTLVALDLHFDNMCSHCFRRSVGEQSPGRCGSAPRRIDFLKTALALMITPALPN